VWDSWCGEFVELGTREIAGTDTVLDRDGLVVYLECLSIGSHGGVFLSRGSSPTVVFR
jgi:hypothetical protein